MKKFILAGLFTIGCFVGSNTHAASFIDNEYGVPERTTQENDYEVITSKLFDGFNCTSTSGYVYEGGGTSSTAGKVNIAGYDDIVIHYNMGNYTASGTYTIKLYTQSGVEDFWADLDADIDITGTATGAFPIMEVAAKAFRAGLITTEIGTTSCTVTLDRRRKKR